MYEWLIFYNYYGNGDLFNSREFVKEISNKLSYESLGYFHLKDPRIFEDLPFTYRIPNANCQPDKSFFIAQNSLHINTWIGLNSSYVLPGIGCTIENNVRMYNDILVKAGTGCRLEGNLENYIPTVDFNKIGNKGGIDLFISQEKRKKVLISNGLVFSKQAENFSFAPIIKKLNENFPEVAFITTEKVDGILSTKEIIQQEGFDLNQIAYLSKFVDIIIGRSSGPYVFTQVRENLMDENKIFMTFTYHENSALFAKNVPIRAKTYWSNATKEDEIYKVIGDLL